ncbi:MAG: pyrF [Gammaproteobacteria bacterium]|nr:pyrF [Gammaproteobacteria bacterium]
MVKQPQIIVALDFSDIKAVLGFVESLSPTQCRLKVGNELFTRGGPDLVRRLVNLKFSVFLDLKFYDIPNTVAQACSAAADLGVWMVNVHALGGVAMMSAGKKALQSYGADAPLLIAVTALTSYNENQWQSLGFKQNINASVLHLAQLTQQAGLDGVVCSAEEAAVLRAQFGSSFCLVTPGIRLEDNAHDDQHRVVTPQAALAAGSDYLVMGRSITRSPNPQSLLAQLNGTLF